MKRIIFTGNSNWTVPVGISSVFLELYGAGAGGCTGSLMCGGGGGGYVDALVSVSSGDILYIIVGQGGQPGNPPVDGTASVIISPSNNFTAGGGMGSCSTCTLSLGGVASGGDINLPGYTPTVANEFGGNCGGGRYAGGGGQENANGHLFGGGGGGTGGIGANGAVIVTWYST